MSEINLPLDIKSLEIVSQSFDKQGNIILDGVSKNDHSTCHKCGKPATKRNGTAPTRLIRHLPILDTPVYLRITPSLFTDTKKSASICTETHPNIQYSLQ